MTLGGDAYCWGSNEQGQLATYPRVQIVHSPTPVLSSTPLVDIQSGGQHGCGLAAGGTVLCWGDNYGDALGDRQLQYPGIDSIPAPVPDAPAFTEIRASVPDLRVDGGRRRVLLGEAFGKKPVRIQIPQAVARIDASSGRLCGMSVQGVAYCWNSAVEVRKLEGQS